MNPYKSAQILMPRSPRSSRGLSPPRGSELPQSHTRHEQPMAPDVMRHALWITLSLLCAHYYYSAHIPC